MTSKERHEVIIVGTGAGGGTLAYHLANAGKRVLILERGPFLPEEKPNWNKTAVFLENPYHTKDVRTGKEGHDLHPGTGYWVGGNTKVYGAALFRLREEDFGVLVTHDGGRGGISQEHPADNTPEGGWCPLFGVGARWSQPRLEGRPPPVDPSQHFMWVDRSMQSK